MATEFAPRDLMLFISLVALATHPAAGSQLSAT